MDKTETYRKMSDCPEIQEQSSKSEGNWWIGSDMVFCIGAYREEMVHEGYTWLPTQGRLQEMVKEDGFLWQLNFDFMDWLCSDPYKEHINHSHLHFTSMEQLWLAFVMKEKHNLIWDGENWVK